VVILATPPGFRPQHLKAAVAAGKHIFCEKPMATDAPGVRSVMASVAEAKRKSSRWWPDFAGATIIRAARCSNGFTKAPSASSAPFMGLINTSPVKPMPPASARKPGTSDVEWQLRNWYNFVWLCGDSLVEQAVHSVDKIAWAMKDVPPLKAVAVGGRQIPAQRREHL